MYIGRKLRGGGTKDEERRESRKRERRKTRKKSPRTIGLPDAVWQVLSAISPFRDFAVFQRIKDYDQFRRVEVALGTIAWDGGLDLDPEFVYAKCKTIAHT